METVSDIYRLIDAIRVGDPSSEKLVEIRTWDGRIIRGSCYKGSEGADVISSEAVIVDGNLLRSHVRVLLRSEKSFIVKRGQSIIEWAISED